jgi:hypothetical protein
MKKVLYYLTVLFVISLCALSEAEAQNVAITDDDGYTADESAMLDVKSTSKGLLIPRLTTAQRNAVANPAQGLLVFDIDEKNFYFFNGTNWDFITSESNAIWSKSGNDVFLTDSLNRVGVGTSDPQGKLEVKGDIDIDSNDPLFEVINSAGDTVFAVYSQGVRINVADEVNKANRNRGGFVVGGFSTIKGNTNEYMRVTPDSVCVYIAEETPNKSSGNRGGFVVGGFSTIKSDTAHSHYFNISGETEANDIIDDSRIVWYPQKEAFSAGHVLIESPDSVGWNSFSTGNTSKAIGNYSQAFGYTARAFGNNSTAIGYFADADGPNSYAFGNYAYAVDSASYAFGSGAKSLGLRSFAIGSSGIDSSGLATDPTVAYGNYSYAFGMGSQSVGKGAFTMGTQNNAIGEYSLAMGYQSNALDANAVAIGDQVEASGMNATAFGYESVASGDYSSAFGRDNIASGGYSTALGAYNDATGTYSTATGSRTMASGSRSFAANSYTTAGGTSSTAFGWRSTASGAYSFALGDETWAQGVTSIASGEGTVADAEIGFSHGYYSKSKSFCEFVIGRYNDTSVSTQKTYWDWNDPIFIIGNGFDYYNRRNAMTVLKNGNVGIGVSDPSYDLEVDGDIYLTGDIILDGSDVVSSQWITGGSGIYYTGRVGIGLTNPTNASLDIESYNGYAIRMEEDGSGTENWSIGVNTSGDLLFYDEYSQVVTFQDGGEVGIGTAYPEAPLDIECNSSNRGLHLEENGSGTEDWQIGVNLNGDLIFYDGTSTSVTFDDNGYVGIGTISPGSHRLFVNSAEGGVAGSSAYLKNTASDGLACIVENSSSSSSDLALLVTTKGAADIVRFDSYHGNNTWDDEFRFNSYGTGYCDGSWQGGGADYAEYFPLADTNAVYEAGTVISFSSKGYPVEAGNNNSSDMIVGVVSDNPAVVGNSSASGPADHHVLVGLLGVIETKVNLDNGPISIGDYITISTEQGVAMKNTTSDVVIGRALEPYSGESDNKIKVFVDVDRFNGTNEENEALKTEVKTLQSKYNQLESELNSIKELLEASSKK